MKTLAFILILVAIIDTSATMAKITTEWQTFKMAWIHRKLEVLHLGFVVVANILAVIVFIAVLAGVA